MCWVIQALSERETGYNVFPYLVAGRKVREKGPGDEVVTQPLSEGKVLVRRLG